MTVVYSYVFLCVLMLVCPTCSKHGFLDVPSRTRHFHLQDVRGSMQNVRHSRAIFNTIAGANPVAADGAQKIENHPKSAPAQVWPSGPQPLTLSSNKGDELNGKISHPDWVKNSCALAPSPKRKWKDEDSKVF